jgi:hypothetical protein
MFLLAALLEVGSTMRAALHGELFVLVEQRVPPG